MKKLVFAHLELSPGPGGIGRSIYNLASELSAKHEVFVITRRSQAYPLPSQSANGFTVLTYKPPRIPMLGFIFPFIYGFLTHRIIDKLNLCKDDTVVYRSLHVASYGATKNQVYRVIYWPPNPIGTILSDWSTGNTGSARARLLRVVYRLCSPRFSKIEAKIVAAANEVVALSDTVKSALVGAYSRDNVRKISPGVDERFFLKKSSETGPSGGFPMTDIEFLRRKYDWILLYVGRLEDEKGILEFSQKFALTGLNSALMIVGDGRQRDEINRLAASCKRIKMFGHQSNLLATFYRSADLTVLPSLTEGFGQVLLESMACGTPCFGYADSRQRNVKTAIQEVQSACRGCFGYEYFSDPQKLGQNLTQALERADTLNASDISEDVRTHFRWSVAADRLDSLLGDHAAIS